MIKKFKQFVNENDSSYIDWESIEELCANTTLPDCVPQNIRQWDAFIKQYERAVDLVNGKWEPHYNWNTQKEFNEAVNEQFSLGKGFKNSIYECYRDLTIPQENLFKNVDWVIVKTAKAFTTWDVFISQLDLDKLPLLPRKVGGDFSCYYNNLPSLEGSPEYVGGYFDCDYNDLESLKGSPKYVGGKFSCSSNNLTSLKGSPEYVGEDFTCANNHLASLKGAPKHVGGYFYCYDNKLPGSVSAQFHGEDLPKYINL